jgi:predicted aspartyl protease
MATRILTGVLFLVLTWSAPAAAQSRPVPFTRTGTSIVVDVIVGGKTRHFLVDTGASMTVLSLDVAGWSLADLRKGVLRRSAVGIDGSSHAMGKSTAALEIARKLIVTPVGVTDLGPLSKALNVKLDGILGQDVLSQFGSVTVDYKNRQLIFEM